MNDHPASDLGTRFHALPTELRARVFSHLLVRPVKWDVPHLESCSRSRAKTTSDHHTRPSHHDLAAPENTYICAQCGPFTHERNWRHAFERGYRVFVSPWRSQWAPPQTNAFLCTNCYDDRWRSRPFPEPTNLPCLCARRRNLEVRVVGRAWNVEASQVFFSENMFAFDECTSMRHFFAAMPERWRTLVTRVSVLLPMWKGDDRPDPDVLATSLSVLGSLTWLREIELDAKLLNTEATALALINCDVPNLRRVRFVVQRPWRQIYWQDVEPPTYVWAECASRRLLTGGFSERVALSMKSRHTEVLNAQTIKDDVQRQRALYQCIQEDAQPASVPFPDDFLRLSVGS
jgi:hypothetical protein